MKKFHLWRAGRQCPPWARRDANVALCRFEVENAPRAQALWAYHHVGAKESTMPDVTIVYWRDIPAQVIVGKGRRGTKAPLPERFEQAIDRAAMKVGAAETDAYLAEWRKAAPYEMDGDPAEIAAAEAARLDAEYDQDRIRKLIDNDGWA
jgi:hypothetical protein